MLRKLSALLVIMVLIGISRSSEVHRSVKTSKDSELNSEVLNKKLLPSVKHLLKDNTDGNRQKFLHLLDRLDIDGFKFVNG